MEEPVKEKKERSDAEEVKKERDEYLAGWQRANADLANFKKETVQSLGRFSDIMKVELIRSLLPVLDSLEEGGRQNETKIEPVRKLFLDILSREGFLEIDAKKGDSFDPKFHEAIQGSGDKIEQVMQK